MISSRLHVRSRPGSPRRSARRSSACGPRSPGRRLTRWRAQDPSRAAEWERAWQGRPAEGLAEALPSFDPAEAGALATRAAGSAVMQAFAPYVPTMLGGAADLAESTKTG